MFSLKLQIVAFVFPYLGDSEQIQNSLLPPPLPLFIFIIIITTIREVKALSRTVVCTNKQHWIKTAHTNTPSL